VSAKLCSDKLREVNLAPPLQRFGKLPVELRQIHKKDDKIKVMTIFPFDEYLGFEVFIIELLPGCTHLSPSHQKGVIEHVIPLNGTIEVLVDQIWHTVNKHEGLRFSADLSHGYRNLSDKRSLFHNIIHYRK
jgi:hypothetical protein